MYNLNNDNTILILKHTNITDYHYTGNNTKILQHLFVQYNLSIDNTITILKQNNVKNILNTDNTTMIFETIQWKAKACIISAYTTFYDEEARWCITELILYRQTKGATGAGSIG